MLCLILLVSPGLLSAGQARDNSTAGGLNVSVDLRHRVVIPQILYLRIGSDGFGEVDKLNFDVAPGGAGVGERKLIPDDQLHIKYRWHKYPLNVYVYGTVVRLCEDLIGSLPAPR